MGRSEPRVWDGVLAHLRNAYPAMCRRWFDDIEPLELSGGTLKLLVREPIQLRYLQQRCQKEFTEAVQAVMELLVAVRFVGESDAPDPNKAALAPRGPGTRAGVAVAAEEPAVRPSLPGSSIEPLG